MKIKCKKIYNKMIGAYEFEGPDKHHNHRRKLKKAYKTILRKRLNKLIDNGKENN